MIIGDNIDQLCTVLLTLSDDYELELFEKRQSNALIAICIRETSSSITFVANAIFSKDSSMVVKMRCIRVFMAIPLILQKVN